MFVIKKEMSFLKISDPVKRDSIVKEYLELKKNIRDNFLSERIGEQQLQTDLSKFYRPITETQKATAREITEGLKPIREGIEKLPEAMQPIGEATGEEDEEDEEEEEEEEDEELVGEIAYEFLNKPFSDKTFGIRKIKKIVIILGMSMLLLMIMILLLERMVKDLKEHLVYGN